MWSLRPALAVIVALGVAALPRVPRAMAVSYAPGWNLVSGPEGSQLVGAEGEIYTRQPGDAGYRSYPAGSRLRSGVGYWAYFPNGGSLAASAGNDSYIVTVVPGEWTLIGNPSATAVARPSGALALLIYVAGDGYVSVPVIPPGAGAWVLGLGRITLRASRLASPQPVAASAVALLPATTRSGGDLLGAAGS